MPNHTINAVALAAIIALTACGGGGESTTTQIQPPKSNNQGEQQTTDGNATESGSGTETDDQEQNQPSETDNGRENAHSARSIEIEIPRPGHGLAHAGDREEKITVDPGATRWFGNISVSCPLGNSSCILEVTPEGKVSYLTSGAKPSIGRFFGPSTQRFERLFPNGNYSDQFLFDVESVVNIGKDADLLSAVLKYAKFDEVAHEILIGFGEPRMASWTRVFELGSEGGTIGDLQTGSVFVPTDILMANFHETRKKYDSASDTTRTVDSEHTMYGRWAGSSAILLEVAYADQQRVVNFFVNGERYCGSLACDSDAGGWLVENALSGFDYPEPGSATWKGRMIAYDFLQPDSSSDVLTGDATITIHDFQSGQALDIEFSDIHGYGRQYDDIKFEFRQSYVATVPGNFHGAVSARFYGDHLDNRSDVAGEFNWYDVVAGQGGKRSTDIAGVFSASRPLVETEPNFVP